MLNHILIVDDEKSVLDVMQKHFVAHQYEVSVCSSGEEALQVLNEKDIRLVITDLKMAGLNGIELCDRIAGNHPDLPVLILTAFGTLDTAVEAIRAGAYDFIVKPVNFDALLGMVEKAIRNFDAKRQVRRLQNQPESSPIKNEEELLGESRSMIELRALIRQITDLDTSVLLTGESGTGKELVSKTLHKQGKRGALPFIVVNCATIPEDAFEQELFGKVDSSQLGTEQFGLVGAAQGGTLFFDEIVHLPLRLQPKLLRLFEERLYRPVGSRQEIICPARFVVSTNVDLDHAVRKGHFREDLFFRINVMHVKLLPLRERGNDILVLAHRFLKLFAARFEKKITSLSDPVTEKLIHYEWPGNVRELRNTIERAVAVTKYDHLIVEDLPENIRRFKTNTLFKEDTADKLIPIDTVEQRHILSVLKQLNGNKALAAKILGMDRKTLYRKLERYGYEE